MSSTRKHFSHPKYRPDIDGLRAIAVLSVVIFHAFPDLIKGGFIGVDIFFVISGYLISTIIFENLDRGTFSFSEFYARRIKRIFPALLLVLISCLIFGWFFLLANEYKQLGKHVAAGTSFVSNFVLLSEAGYFDNSAETKPLLHLWSLGIEEQFYFIWPFILWFAWRKKFNLLSITICIAMISFYLNISEVKNNSVATFYSPQTRFWELLCGSILAWFTIYQKGVHSTFSLKLDNLLRTIAYRDGFETKGNTLANATSFSGLLILFYGFLVINKDLGFPGIYAVIPVLGAVMIILSGPEAWFNRMILSSRVFIWVGLISYPLYLWHWPLLSFTRIMENRTPSISVRIFAIATAFLLAWITYKFIEHPLRATHQNKFKVILLVVLMVLTGTTGYIIYRLDGMASLRFDKSEMNLKYENYLKYPAPTEFRAGKCFLNSTSNSFSYFDQKLCIDFSETNKNILLIGDSHAAHWYQALSEKIGKKINLSQITASGCRPTINPYGEQYCIDLINWAYGTLTNKHHFDKIIISGRWRKNEAKDLTSTILSLKGKTNHVVVFGPTIEFDSPLPTLLAKSNEQKYLMAHSRYERIRSIDQSIKQATLEAGAEYISILDTMCPQKEICITTIQSIPMLFDSSHLTFDGAKYLLDKIKL